MIFWGMGVSQHIHGTDNARCLISLALMTGQIGRPARVCIHCGGRTTCRVPLMRGLIRCSCRIISPCLTPACGRLY